MIGHLNEIVERDRQPVSRWALGAWLVFYGLFLIYAFTQDHGFLFIDSANLVVHEGGHLLFGWFGHTLGLWGGTILQWLEPSCNGWCRCCWRHISLSSVRPLPSPFACSSFLKTGFNPKPI